VSQHEIHHPGSTLETEGRGLRFLQSIPVEEASPEMPDIHPGRHSGPGGADTRFPEHIVANRERKPFYRASISRHGPLNEGGQICAPASAYFFKTSLESSAVHAG